MDYYLQNNAVYNRLKEEYFKYGKLILAVDFDDTLFDFHKLGRNYDDIISLLRKWRNYSEIIIFTSRPAEQYQEIKNYLNENNIPYNSINEDSNLASFGGRKIYANAYINDRAGLSIIYQVLSDLIEEISQM